MKYPYNVKATKEELFETMLEMYKEIERLTAESTEWESKFYEEAKKNNRAIEYINKDLANINIQENVVAYYELLKVKNKLEGKDNE